MGGAGALNEEKQTQGGAATGCSVAALPSLLTQAS
jgi:hypothetical protein